MLFSAKEKQIFIRKWSFQSSNGFFSELGNKLSVPQILKWVLAFLIGFYRTILVTHMGGTCRFSPSCSEYAVEAINRCHPYQAVVLIARRLLRCRPFGPSGFDPIPESCKARLLMNMREGKV